MMIIDKMKNLPYITNQEQAVVDYILKNPRALLTLTISELAKASYTSTSTIVRLCKKLEVKGYADLKFLYAKEYAEIEKQYFPLRQPFEASPSIDELIEILPLIYHRTIDQTKSMLSRNTIIRVTNLMKQAKRIEIYGTAIHYDLAKMMAFRFESVDKDCFVYNTAHWEHLKYLEYKKIPTLAILISSTGKNPAILDAARFLKQSGVKTLSISSTDNNKLASMTDESIQILNLKNDLELKTIAFGMAVQYILDVCISSLMVYQMDDIDKITESLKGARERWNLK